MWADLVASEDRKGVMWADLVASGDRKGLMWADLVAGGDRKGVMWADSVASGDRRVQEWCGQIQELWRWGELSWTDDYSLNFTKEHLRRASKKNITTIKPRWNMRRNESFGGFERNILPDWTDPPDLQVRKLIEFVHLFLNAGWLSEMTPRLRGALEGGMSLRPTRKKEDQFQEQSLFEEFLFCPHLTAVYSELPRPSHLKCRIRWSVRQWLL